MVVQKETRSFDDAPPEQHVEMQPIAEPSIQPITNHNTDAVDDDEPQETVEYSTHSPNFEQSSDTTGPSTPTTSPAPPLHETESLPKLVPGGGPTRQGSDIYYDPN
jgi:hypothetical protein